MVNGSPMEIEVDSDEDGAASRLQNILHGDRGQAPEPSSPSQSQRSTKSISESLLEPVFENGRTYTNETYFLPNDEAEQTRNSIMHQMCTMALSGQLTLHRLKDNVSRILDIGANPCDWAIALAEKYPNCEIVATDLFPHHPSELPPNIEFEIDDAHEEWTYTEPFDYIHIRTLVGAWPDWKSIYQQAHRHLAPEGWLEIVDQGPVHHNTPVSNSYLEIYNGACETAANNAGISLELNHLHKDMIEEVGLRVFRSITIDIPIGQWPADPQQKSIGRLALVGTLERLEAQSMRLLTKHLSWSPKQVSELCTKVMEELLHPATKPSMPCTFVVARKLPLAP